ncbi:ribonuclease E inhibitor RraB [Aestuariimicrobium ganziense]|uniref:ribonuclease E inhibitor RraB n=1 Tax=Aestuariimicrobium ganziense TaxID=2773677 RepID=UPI00194258CC|nr:ribonuclease E inhibitor RraB [Aestuariimicrobium ganziense]
MGLRDRVWARHVNRGDRRTLKALAKHSDLSQPRDWTHFVHCLDEAGARAAADRIRSAGWTIIGRERISDDGGWLVVAGLDQAVLDAGGVARARAFFSSLEREITGLTYQGWEAGAD